MKKSFLALVAGVVFSVVTPIFPASAALPARSVMELPDFATLSEQVGAAVVNINVIKKKSPSYRRSPGRSPNISPDDPFYEFFRHFGAPFPGQPGGAPWMEEGAPRIAQGVGSGFIVSADGYVLTNAHVVENADGETEVTVTLNDKREFKAKIIGSDERTDVAVIKIDAKDLPVVKMGDPKKARVGEWVMAVGSPFGFENSVTAGIISAKARRLQSENYVPFIQSDVAINPGNSGGPLFNLAGEVIGINSQIYSRSGGFMGISFSIPIDVALGVKEQLIKHGSVQRGKLGVTIQSVTQDLAQNFGLDKARGALVSRVEAGSAGAKAGLQEGDVVLAVNGEKVSDANDLPRIIGEKMPGSKITIELWRSGKTLSVEATLDRLQSRQVAQNIGDPEKQDKLGLSVRALTSEERRKLEITEGQGVLVESSSGSAAQAGVRMGDVILAVNNQSVGSVDKLRQLIDAAGKRFALLIQRGEGRIYVPVRSE